MEMVDRDTARHWLGNLDYIFIDIRSKQEWGGLHGKNRTSQTSGPGSSIEVGKRTTMVVAPWRLQ